MSLLNEDVWFVPKYWRQYDLEELYFHSYRVNRCGDIYSVKRMKKKKSFISTYGYKKTILIHPEKGNVNIAIRRLVACTFIENNNKLLNCFIDHINGIKTDDCVYNLEWVTPKENAIRANKLSGTHIIHESEVLIAENQLSLFPDER